MYSCPACGTEGKRDLFRCSCGADLALLEQLEGVADAWFNRALAALAEDRPGRALEWLAACCAARPTDAAAGRALARVWAQLGCWDQAADALDRAAALDPDAPETAELRQALATARAAPVEISPTPKRELVPADAPNQN